MWFYTDHTYLMMPANLDLLTWPKSCVHTADSLKLIETFTVLVDHHEAHFVHVSIDLNPQWIPGTSLLANQHAPHRVDADLIGKGLDFVQHDLANLRLIS
jgi:hypothetical protein